MFRDSASRSVVAPACDRDRDEPSTLYGKKMVKLPQQGTESTQKLLSALGPKLESHKNI